jgi:hypothetical protein
MKKFTRFMQDLLYHWDIEIAEVQSILAIIFVASSLLLDPYRFNSILAEVLPKGIYSLVVFSVLMLAAAASHFLGLLEDSMQYRRIGNILSCMMWVYLTVVVGARHDMFALLAATFALSSALVYLRLTKLLALYPKQ